MSELLGMPPSLFTATGWGALGTALIITWVMFAKGALKTGSEYRQGLADNKAAFDARVSDLKEFFTGRLADKDAIIAEKTEANKFLMETVEILEGQLGEMVRASETSEHVIQAIQEAAQMSAERSS